MAETVPNAMTAVFDRCREQLAAVTDSLNLCCETQLRLEWETATDWIATDWTTSWSGPGVAIIFPVRNAITLCIIPDKMPLPDWLGAPSDQQHEQLAAFAEAWEAILFPDQSEPVIPVIVPVSDLVEFITHCHPADGTTVQELGVEDPIAGMKSSLALIGPLRAVPDASDQFTSPSMDEADLEDESHPPRPSAPPHDPLARLRKLPVQVAVRLAEKRISVSQLLSIAPGTLLTFNKSCEDLLDLYVNNALYGRGEAVKIGENFGLKVNQVGVVQERASKVFNG